MQLSHNDILLVVDGKSNFSSVQAMYGSHYRINYKKITEHIEGQYPGKAFHKYFYMTMRDEGKTRMQFIERIEQLGYTPKLFFTMPHRSTGRLEADDDMVSTMISDISTFQCEDGSYPGTVIVTSGNGILADVLAALTYVGVTVIVYYFGYALSHKIVDVAEKISLSEEMLFLAS